MKNWFLLSMICLLSIFSLSSEEGYEVFEKRGITFSWKISGDSMDIILKAKTKGWVAVGFDPVSKMKGANFIIAAVSKGEVIIHDHFGNNYVSHISDDSKGGTDDVVLKSGSEEEGYTEIAFSIPLDSKDQYDVPLGPGKHKVILAYGSSDNLKAKHVMIASTEITIPEYKMEESKDSM